MGKGVISDEQLNSYRDNGFIVVKGMLDAAESELLRQVARRDCAVDRAAYRRADGEGGSVRLSLWTNLENNIYGAIARSESIAGSAEKILGGEVYHYHSKLVMKDPKVGGAWAWHQDYGYWYQNGMLFPLLTSAYIAIDRATRENGCMQVVKGSHKLGRLDHVAVGDQTGADPDRMREILQRMELVYVEMEPGDTLLFDCNLLHRSDQNHSQNSRWSLICCYSAARNISYKESDSQRYRPLVKQSDAEIRKFKIESV